jgi:hypothetical protein
MTDDMAQAAEARARARAMLARAAERRAAAPAPDPTPEPEPEPQQQDGGLHDLLRDTAAYLGDRPSRDAEAMMLYARVMAMLGGAAE